MNPLTPLGLVKVLGQVTVILCVTLLGGAISGIILDRAMGTSPLYFLVGFGLGNLAAVVGIALLIRSGQRRIRGTRVATNAEPSERDAQSWTGPG